MSRAWTVAATPWDQRYEAAGSQVTRAADTVSFDLAAGTYDIRAGSTDLLSVVHGGGAYWPADADGKVSQVLVYTDGALA